MRLLFSCTPAFGHFLPLVPLARAARDGGHDVAIMTSAGMAVGIENELPGVTFLPAGPMPEELFAEVARRIPTYDQLGVPDPAAVAELFAGTRVDLTIDDAVAAAETWRPDVVVAEAVDFVGPLAAAVVGVPSVTVAFGPALPDEFSRPMFAVVAPRWEARELTMAPPIGIIDPAPVLLQAPGWQPNQLLIPVRAEPHRREIAREPMATFASGARTRVLVTLGTVFTEDALLQDIISSIDAETTDVVATVGVLPGAALPADSDHVHYERFRPMAELLEGIDAVVSAGGAGTVLAALSQGTPLVLIPQGADQFINAARAAEAGVAIVVAHPGEVGAAVSRLISDGDVAAASAAMRDATASRPSPADAVATVVERVRSSQRVTPA